MTKFNISKEWTEKALREHNPEPDQYTPNILDLTPGYINKCYQCGFTFQHLDKRAVTCPTCEKLNTERSQMHSGNIPDGLPGCDDMAKAERLTELNTDNYYKGRADQASEDLEFYKKVKAEHKDNLLSFLKEVRSESLSDETATSRNRVEAIIRYVERQ